MVIKCLTCSKPVAKCRSVCSSLQPMITTLLEKVEESTSGMERLELRSIIKVLAIIETERDMDKAVKKVKKIYE